LAYTDQRMDQVSDSSSSSDGESVRKLVDTKRDKFAAPRSLDVTELFRQWNGRTEAISPKKNKVSAC
jgi:hypothetical protein